VHFIHLLSEQAAPLKALKRTGNPQTIGQPSEAQKEVEQDPIQRLDTALSTQATTIEVNDQVEEKPTKKRKRRHREEDEKADDIESRYLDKMYASSEKQDDLTNANTEPINGVKSHLTADPESDDEIDPDLLQHESLTPSSNRAEKTIFISNLPVKVLTSKPHLNSLKRLFAEYGSIESIRFRSIAFTDLIPRKVAFITKILHPQRDTLNAYIVYSTADSVDKAVNALNGTLWEDKHLRVDSVSNPTVTFFCSF
jgi:nucleolar protein 12